MITDSLDHDHDLRSRPDQRFAVTALGVEHLRDAMTELSRHLLALGSRLAYGGDLRPFGFTKLLFELVARHRRDADDGDERPAVVNYLAWPVHVSIARSELLGVIDELADIAEIVMLGPDGELPLDTTLPHRAELLSLPTDADWRRGLGGMRLTVCQNSDARILLGGRLDGYKGRLPGIAEEAILSMRGRQPTFLLGGFGGCTRAIAEALGVVEVWAGSRAEWSGRDEFEGLTVSDLNNGLNEDENAVLARTPHVDQAVTLVVKGLLRLAASAPTAARPSR